MPEPQPDRPPTSLGRHIVRALLAVLAALWMVLEEWIWDSLTAVMAALGRLPPVRWLERRVARLSPYAAMSVFVLPWLVLLPAKVLAFWFIGTGHLRLGVLVFVLAKVIGTALLARLFTLTRPALLSIAWFRRLHAWFTSWRDRLYAFVRSLRAWQIAKAWLAALRGRWRAFRLAHRRR